MILNSNSNVELADDQSIDIADIQFDFTQIADVSSSETVKTVDIIGVIHRDMGTREINTKNGNRKLRSFVLIDNSKMSNADPQSITGIEVNMWGDQVDEIQLQEGEIVGLKRCRTNEFRGSIRLNASVEEGLYFKQDLKIFKECLRINQWYRDIKSKNINVDSLLVNVSGASSEGGNKYPTKLIVQAVHDGDEIFF